jgi:hypothetical protein
MLYLDTNYLIQGLVKGSKEAAELSQWYGAGQTILAPAPAWFEFLCGPITQAQINTIRGISFGRSRTLRRNTSSSSCLFIQRHRQGAAV